MGGMFVFKKLSGKITFIIGVTVVIVAGMIAVYMQSRIITEIGRYAKTELQLQSREISEKSALAFVDAIYKVEGLRNLAETSIDVREYKNNAARYITGYLNENIGSFIHGMLNNSEYLSAAYLSFHPDLSGAPYVGEIFYTKTGNVITYMNDPLPYEDFQESDPDMQWFYGAYNSGDPYWTQVYTDETGIIMISYVVPVIIGGEKVGVAGADIPIDHIEDLLKNVKVYDTGVVLLEDGFGDFIETNAITEQLEAGEKEKLSRAARESSGEVFEMKLGKKTYMIAAAPLSGLSGGMIYAAAPKNEVNAEVTSSLIRFAVIFIVCFILVILISYKIAKPIAKPLTALSSFLKRAASTGDLVLQPEDSQAIDKYSRLKDETGQVMEDAAAFVRHIAEIAEALEVIAAGDLTHEMMTQSDKDTMGVALAHLFENLNNIFGEIKAATNQVAAGSKQIADGSQSLAQGTTQQAAAVEQLSSSIAHIAQKTKDNAEMAARAADFADSIKDSAEKGSRRMDDMMEAVKDINQASQNIEKVIKVIDDIAFQTNILALNAAVEAARAGQHGKGFAVVAEEVRNLASKSAEAAKDTGSLITNSIEKADLGARISGETAESLEEIVSGINESGQIVAQIAKSSEEQSAEIAQINTGIDQVAKVIQQNSATAQQSAAASEEMSGQSGVLEDLIMQFKLKDVKPKNIE
ncbi:MAG: methyl-accepting chemotaxis protein [Oscillospiraceae bacterium]|nr:methyl-accepting chemotaxis protein [Oscillospiraceae bacterium]